MCTTRNSLRAAGFGFTLLDTSGNSNPATQPLTNPPTPTNMSTAQPRSAHTNLVDDDTLDKTPGTTDPNAEATAFPKAIDKIIKANYSHSKPVRATLWQGHSYSQRHSRRASWYDMNTQQTSTVVILRDQPEEHTLHWLWSNSPKRHSKLMIELRWNQPNDISSGQMIWHQVGRHDLKDKEPWQTPEIPRTSI